MISLLYLLFLFGGADDDDDDEEEEEEEESVKFFFLDGSRMPIISSIPFLEISLNSLSFFFSNSFFSTSMPSFVLFDIRDT